MNIRASRKALLWRCRGPSVPLSADRPRLLLRYVQTWKYASTGLDPDGPRISGSRDYHRHSFVARKFEEIRKRFRRFNLIEGNCVLRWTWLIIERVDIFFGVRHSFPVKIPRSSLRRDCGEPLVGNYSFDAIIKPCVSRIHAPASIGALKRHYARVYNATVW